MYTKRVIARGFVIGFAVLLAGAVMAFIPAPIWVRVIVTGCLGAGVIKMATNWLAVSPAVVAVFEEPVAPSPPSMEESVVDVLLPSRREDYGYMFSATVAWLPICPVAGEPTFSMAALAVDAVLKRAREITESRDPSQVSLVRHELAGALAEMREDGAGRLWAWAESVRLRLPDQDQHRLNKLATVRKEKDIWEHERKYEQSKREYLGDDVLKDPGSAVVWWLAKNDEQVDRTVRDIGLLAQLSSAANNIEVPETFQQVVAGLASTYGSGSADPGFNGSGGFGAGANGRSAVDHFDAFMATMGMTDDDPRRTLFARQVANLANAYGREDVAAEMGQRFDMPDEDEYPPDPDDEG